MSMAHALMNIVWKLIYPLFAVLVMSTSFNVAANPEVRESHLSSKHVLENATQSSQVPTPMLLQGNAHLCCATVPTKISDLSVWVFCNGFTYAICQQTTIVSVYRSPDLPPPR